jgi:predicted ABC-type ATPase
VADAVVIAGGNGAGKTSFARHLVPALYPHATFLNADEIQREAACFESPIAAGRELVRRLRGMEEARRSFVIEFTLCSPGHSRRILSWRSLGYHVVLHYIEVNRGRAVERVNNRVEHGGHSVPEADVLRRTDRSTLEFSCLMPVVDEWYRYITDDEGLRLVDWSHAGGRGSG